MKLRKIGFSLLITIITLTILGMSTKVNAASTWPETAGPYYLGIELYRDSGYGYMAKAIPIFKITKYPSSTSQSMNGDKSKTLYCIKAGPGFGSRDTSTGDYVGEQSIRTYNKKSDLKDAYSTTKPISSPYVDVLPTGDNYKALIWVLEHCYVPEIDGNTDQDRKTFLANAGISNGKLTADDIDVVQQLAIWRFTNSDESKYTNENMQIALRKASDPSTHGEYHESSYTPLTDYTNGWDRDVQAEDLYDYLVNGWNNAGRPEPSNQATKDLISIDSTDPQIIENGSNYILGPYTLNKLVNRDFTMTATLKNGSTNIPYQILNSSRQVSTLDNVLGQQFYISVSKDAYVSGSEFTVTTSADKTTIWYWSVTAANLNALEYDQPVVEIEKTRDEDSKKIYTPNISTEKIFDLSLRKYITHVNGISITYVKIPNVDVSPLVNNTATTARYNHHKAPVSVMINDIVTYTIRVYNEGELDGYVTQIKDHLPAELEFIQSESDSKCTWSVSADGRTVVGNIKSENNKLLKAFDSSTMTTLDYMDITIKCKVKSVQNSSKIITNIADITGFTDADGNSIIDRDSQANNVTLPTSKEGWEDYKGKDTNKNNLSDSTYYYEGQQDDDDFDKLEIKTFDLALRKYITSVRDKNGTPKQIASREPVIGTWEFDEYQTLQKNHTKDPVRVETGDTVLYTIKVYNEGEIDGKATKITDFLPEGLRLKDGSSVNSIWTNPSGDGRTLVTTALSDRILNAYDGTTLDSAYVQVECVVVAEESTSGQSLKNIAEITEAKDKNGNDITDRDSEPGNVITNPYNPTNPTNGRGEQDDDDFEELLLPAKEFDLALRKFIVKVNETDVATREPQITDAEKAKLKNVTAKFDDGRTAEKTHTKTPVRVNPGDTVLYTIRVYNEGDLDGKATVVTDNLPEGLALKENSTINTDNGWTNPTGDRKTIVTSKLSDRVLSAFNGTDLDYADLQVECVVIAEAGAQSQSLKNIAEITEAKDKNGNEIIDRDSEPGNVNTNPYNPTNPTNGRGEQDDDDYEELVIPGREFDLSLRKFITKVNDKDLIDNTGKFIKEPVVDVTPLVNYTGTTAEYKHQKAPVGVAVENEVIYTIRVYNEGELDGYVTEITDHLPKELEFVNDEFNANYGWTVSSDGRTVKTTITSPNTTYSASRDAIYADRLTGDDKVLLKAFDGSTMTTPDYIEVQIKCKVKSVENSNSIITNIADITGFTDSNGNNVIDRDSQANNVILPTTEQDWADYKGNDSNKSVLTDKNYHYKGQQDDDDFDKLILQEFDLALRKFITSVNETQVTNRYPVFTTEKDENGNYVYRHTKEPVLVESIDLVEYTIRIYNEGDIAGYAKVVKDNIPEGLEFVPTNETNTEYRWKMLDENGNETTDVSKAKYITTDYLSKEQEVETGRKNLINSFDTDTMATPDYKDVKAVFKVIAPNSHTGIITNTAEIADDSDENGNDITDRDSTPDNNNPKEDDIDVEHIRLQYFDLALRKFITGVNSTEITNRIPVFKITEDGKYVYEHTKEPVDVTNGDIVTYTLRVYNEGTKAGYAQEVKDDLPEGLLFLPDNEINKNYRWVMLDENGEETDDVSKAVSIKTDYLSKEQEAQPKENLLKAFDSTTMNEPDFRFVQIAFRVIEPNTSDRILINKAQISDDADENGKPVVDIDSTPDKWIDGEDDQDIEKVKVKYFDLALRKWVTQAIVIENGKEKVTNTGHKAEDDPEGVVKVEIEKSKLNKVVVKFRYSIRITNEGEIAGYATEISDYIPEGLKFVAADNPNWKEADGKIITNQLADTLLQPGESAEVEVLLTWINGANNMGLKVNVAEISKDKNDSNTPDIDSTPNNKKEGEDDIDDAPVILATKTGESDAIAYIIITTASMAILSSGIVLIKKYIL